MPVQGAEREYFYFPQNYDFLHLSVGDWRSVDFLRDLIERLAPEVVHFHHYHRVGVESFRAARLAAPDAVICLTFHEMMAICMAHKTGFTCASLGRRFVDAGFPTTLVKRQELDLWALGFMQDADQASIQRILAIAGLDLFERVDSSF